MLVYHGSVKKIKNPNVKFSRKNIDFGCGFYITKFKSQAKKWALRKKLILNKRKSFVNIYELDVNYVDCNYKLFINTNSEWLDFVCDCRKGKNVYKKYDIIEGPVADDKVYVVVDMYRNGIWDKKKTLNELKYYKVSNQICFIYQHIIDKYLKYVDCEEINDD